MYRLNIRILWNHFYSWFKEELDFINYHFWPIISNCVFLYRENNISTLNSLVKFHALSVGDHIQCLCCWLELSMFQDQLLYSLTLKIKIENRYVSFYKKLSSVKVKQLFWATLCEKFKLPCIYICATHVDEKDCNSLKILRLKSYLKDSIHFSLSYHHFDYEYIFQKYWRSFQIYLNNLYLCIFNLKIKTYHDFVFVSCLFVWTLFSTLYFFLLFSKKLLQSIRNYVKILSVFHFSIVRFLKIVSAL